MRIETINWSLKRNENIEIFKTKEKKKDKKSVIDNTYEN